MKEVIRDDVVVCREESMTALEEVLQTEMIESINKGL